MHNSFHALLTCQTPTMALAIRISKITKGSTKAVIVPSPSSNQANTCNKKSHVTTYPVWSNQAFHIQNTLWIFQDQYIKIQAETRQWHLPSHNGFNTDSLLFGLHNLHDFKQSLNTGKKKNMNKRYDEIQTQQYVLMTGNKTPTAHCSHSTTSVISLI